MADARRYVIHEVLGSGGFGTVYRAELHAGDGFTKEVALKVLHPDEDRPEHVARLRDEARVLGLVRHRALVSVDELVRLEGRSAVVMELVRGVPLDLLGQGAGLPPSVALGVVAEVASALAAAWDAVALVHRDVKPGNVLVTVDGDVKLVDFGLARAEFPTREAKSRAVVMGTLPYLSPERLELVDLPAGDVFALGVTLAELVSGTEAGPATARPEGHAARVESLLAASAGAGTEVVALLRRMLAFAPNERPSAGEVAEVAGALAASGSPSLRDWARAVVPGARLRAQASGEWTGRRFSPSGAETEDGPVTFTFEPGPDPVPLPAARPPAPTTGWRWLVGGIVGAAAAFGGLGAGVVLVGTVAFGALAWVVSAPITALMCGVSVDDMERTLAAAPPSPEVEAAAAVARRARRGCGTGDLGLFGSTVLLQSVDVSLRDGVYTAEELADLELLASGLPPSP